MDLRAFGRFSVIAQKIKRQPAKSDRLFYGPFDRQTRRKSSNTFHLINLYSLIAETIFFQDTLQRSIFTHRFQGRIEGLQLLLTTGSLP